MANFDIPENPEYSDKIRMFETTDPGHADIFNPVIEQLIKNDVFLLKEKQTPNGDAKDNVVTFTSEDDENPTSWTAMTLFKSKLKLSGLFNKISIMARNVRFLYKVIGTTDISSVGDGTVTNAIKKLKEEQPNDATQSAHGLMTAADKKKLDGIAEKANNYTHPSEHAASMITQDATHRFVSDTEKTTWGNKLNKSDVTQSAAVTTAGQKALDAIEKNASIEGTLANQLSQINSNIGNIKHYVGTVVVTSDSVGRFWLPIPERAVGITYNVLNAGGEIDCTTPLYNSTWGNDKWYSLFVSQYSREKIPNATLSVAYSYWA